MQRAFIWGCGRNGLAACSYYANRYEIAGFIDNNKSMHGTMVAGRMVYAPSIIHTLDVDDTVIIAMKSGKDSVFRQIGKQQNVIHIILFTGMTDEIKLNGKKSRKKQIIILYQGGLGNQMFQYALARQFMAMGRYVTADLALYNRLQLRRFVLKDTFNELKVIECDNAIYMKYKYGYHDKNSSIIKYKIFQEKDASSAKTMFADVRILAEKEGVFEGYWQSEKYFKPIRKLLLEEFHFKYGEEKLQALAEKMKKENAVAIHVRRTDYVNTAKQRKVYGDICTEAYYLHAINIINSQVKNPVLYFFSDDMEWVKEHIRVNGSNYIDNNTFDRYQDWYDMYLMTVAKHNIIANSSFGWWGAWLNNNIDQIVIAPEKWINGCDMPDICPESWIRI